VRANAELAGVRVVNHRETPGLGDKLELAKADWILDFNGKSLAIPAPERWAVRKDGGDFDQFTGATITPRAVVQAVHRALIYFSEHREVLLQLTPEELARGSDEPLRTDRRWPVAQQPRPGTTAWLVPPAGRQQYHGQRPGAGHRHHAGTGQLQRRRVADP